MTEDEVDVILDRIELLLVDIKQKVDDLIARKEEESLCR